MSLKRFRARILSLVQRRRFERELEEELLFHLEMETRNNRERGMDPLEARFAAERAFGGLARAKEQVRTVRGLDSFDSWFQDARSAVRFLRRSPGFTLVAVLTLALGVGVNTAIFHVVKQVLLRAVPYLDADGVVLLQQSAEPFGRGSASLPFSVPELEAYRASSATIEALVEYHSMPFTLLGDGVPERVDTGVVSAGFFDLLRVRPLLGRTFLPGEDAVGADPVLVLSYEYWQHRYQGDPAVLGRVLEMNDRKHRVVGVLPPLPRFPDGNDVFMPISSCPFRSAPGMRTSFDSRMVQGLARLRPGVTAAGATEDLAAIAENLRKGHPEAYRGFTSHDVSALPLAEALTGRARPALLLLLATAVFVLVIAGSNLSNLRLAEISGRSRELALRSAIGANRWQLLRALGAESLLLALAGALLSLVLAWALVGSFVALAGRLTPREISGGLDLSTLTFAFALALAVGLGAGLFPLLVPEGRSRSGPRAPLVVAQLGVSLVLMAGAGLTLRSLYRLETVERGFEVERVLTMHLDLDWNRYQTPESIGGFHSRLLAALGRLPGVSASALGRSVPLSGREGPEREPVRTPDGRRSLLDAHSVSPGYFRAIGIPVLEGRAFTDADGPRSTRVAILSQAAATLGLGNEIEWGGERYAVVGVVGDVRQYGLAQEAEPSIYFSLAQVPLRVTDLMVRTDAEPLALRKAIEASVHTIDPRQAVAYVSTLEEAFRESVAAPRILARLLLAFAVLALAITAVGLGGSLALVVERRTREIGIRLALGALPRDVSRLVLRQGMGLVLAGLALGVPAALALASFLSGQLFQIEPHDPITFVGVSLFLVMVAVLTSLASARRALRIDPLATIRAEGDC